MRTILAAFLFFGAAGSEPPKPGDYFQWGANGEITKVNPPKCSQAKVGELCWKDAAATPKPVERPCVHCGEESEDSGLRWESWQIFACPRGHVWVKRLEPNQ